MRKRIILLLLLCLLPLSGFAEQDALFPAKGENGLWGYINTQAEWVIVAKYEDASPFIGSYAAVTVEYDEWGLIDSTGDVALPMEYLIDWKSINGLFLIRSAEAYDMNVQYAVENGLSWCGYFDPETDFFSGTQWRDVEENQFDKSVLTVRGDNDLFGFIRREDGEVLLPCQFYDVGHGFSEDWCVVQMAEDEDECALVSKEGLIVRPPDGMYLNWSFYNWISDGLVLIMDKEYLFGYMNTEGKIVLPPQWGDAYPFNHGFAVVSDELGYYLYIDPEGNLLEGISARPEGQGGYEFVDGLQTVFYNDRPAAMNTEGEIEFVLEDEDIFWLWNYQDNGLAWYMKWLPEKGDYWYEQLFYGLVDRQGNLIGDQLWIYGTGDEDPQFSEGLAAVKPMDENAWCYVDEKGEMAVPALYTRADAFHNGLAYVEKSGLCGYIDLSGNEVHMWELK